MIELVRIVENQSSLSSYRATQNEERAVQLELLIETTKPDSPHHEWHSLIMTPFRYSPPHPQGRFRPSYGKNVFYGSIIEETALYEQAFHMMKQRVHLDIETETGIRTIFFAEADDTLKIDINDHPDMTAITNKDDYSASQQFITSTPGTTFILYPSCRDPQRRNNVAIFDINHLSKNIKWESSIKFFYDNSQKKIAWLDYQLHIQWAQVA